MCNFARGSLKILKVIEFVSEPNIVIQMSALPRDTVKKQNVDWRNMNNENCTENLIYLQWNDKVMIVPISKVS